MATARGNGNIHDKLLIESGWCFLGGIASCSASDSAYFYTFLRSVVCLSVVCHIRAPYLNRSTDLDAIWQVHFIVGSNDTLC